MEDKRKLAAEQLMRLQLFMNRHQLQFGPLGNPHRGRGRVLAILKMRPEITQKELSYLLDMSKQALSELLLRLEKSGHITREMSLEDRRVFNIKLTESGAAAADSMEETDSELERMLGCLTNEELDNLIVCLRRVVIRFVEESKDDDAKRFMEMVKERHALGHPHWDEEHAPFGGHEHLRPDGHGHPHWDVAHTTPDEQGNDEKKGEH